MMTTSGVFAFSALLFSTSMPVAAQQLVEECHGTETVKMGTGRSEKIPYSLVFRADFAANTYCYGPCGKEQTYIMADATSSPMRLVDLEKGGQKRHLVFDRVSGMLTDYQVFDAGLGTVTRNASATCKPSKP